MSLLVRDGLLYFFLYVPVSCPFYQRSEFTRYHVTISTFLYGFINMLYFLGKIPQEWLIFPATDVPVYILTPRFVMNIRELYALEVDTGFGLSSGVGRGVGGTTAITTMAFVEGCGIGGSDDGEETVAAGEVAQSGDGQPSSV